MTEPRIQYVTTGDGISIAYAVTGEGRPLLRVPTLPVSHLQLVWQAEFARDTIVMRGRTYITYDARGFGLSQRDVTDFSLDTLVRDIEAIVDHLGLGQIQVMAAGYGVPIAIAYAAAHPDRVSHLALSAYASAQGMPDEEIDAIMALGEKNWELATETLTHAVLGWANSATAHQVAAVMRASASPETLRTFIGQIRNWRVEDLAPAVAAPTIVVGRSGGPGPSFDTARDLAAAIPNARLAMIEGPLDMSNNQEAATIASFLSDGAVLMPSSIEAPHTTLTILFTDVVDSTSLTERLGDAAFRGRAHQLDDALRSVIREGGGTPVEGKVLGDGVMAVFTSARQAIDTARRCRDAADDVGLQLHLGIHAGDVIRDGNNVYGGAVNLAARIAGHAEPGEILVSDVVRGLARTSAGVAFEDCGEHALKGIADPQRLYAIRDH